MSGGGQLADQVLVSLSILTARVMTGVSRFCIGVSGQVRKVDDKCFNGDFGMKLYTVAVQCKERRKESTKVYFGATYAVVANKNEAIGMGITMAKNTWPKCEDHQCAVEEIPNEVLMEVLPKVNDEGRRDDTRATELEWLQWFHGWADFGIADSVVREDLKMVFMKETGKNLPEGYNLAADGETVIDMVGGAE